MSHRATAAAGRAIELALRDEHFHLDDVRRDLDDAPAQSTIYRVLQQLESDEWIEQRGNGWAPGMKATMLGGGDDTTDGSGASFEIDTDDLLG